MNTLLFLVYLAIGIISKWLTMKRPTNGERAIALPILLIGAFLVAWIVPENLNAAVIPVLAVFHTGEMIGRWIGIGIDKIRVMRISRQLQQAIRKLGR